MDDTHSRHTIRPFSLGRSLAAKMEPSYKVDEGYSEETRSQEEMDETMRMDPGDESAVFGPYSSGAGLQDTVLALGENERRGESLCLLLGPSVVQMFNGVIRDRVYHLTEP